MTETTLLLRQAHPNWVNADGSVASIAFVPFEKDENQLSLDDGDRITPEAAFTRYIAKPNCKSAGVWAILVHEALQQELPVRDDPLPENPEHMVLDFTGLPPKVQKAKAAFLAADANRRGCLFRSSIDA